MYKVNIVLYKQVGLECKLFSCEKEVGAANPEQACEFAKKMFEGLLQPGVVINASIVD